MQNFIIILYIKQIVKNRSRKSDSIFFIYFFHLAFNMASL
jgi:hypothetical protein